MKNRLLVSVVALEVVLAAVFGVLRYRTLDAIAHAPITFGFIEPLTGDMAMAGIEDRQAKQLAVDELNRAGGVDGHPIVALWNDGACDARTSELAAQELGRHATVVFTGPCATETLGAAAVTQIMRVPLVTSTSPGKAISFAGDLVYRMAMPDASEGELVGGYLAENRAAKSVVVLSGLSGAERERRAGFVREVSAQGATIAVDQTLGALKDATPSLLVSIQRAQPDAIYLNVDDSAVAATLIKQFGWYAIKAPVVVTKESGQWEGVLVSGQDVMSTNPSAAAFLVGYQAAYETNPSDPAAASHAYDSVYLVAEAIEAVGTDAIDIREYLDAPDRTWETSFGTTRFDENGDAAYAIHVNSDTYNP